MQTRVEASGCAAGTLVSSIGTRRRREKSRPERCAQDGRGVRTAAGERCYSEQCLSIGSKLDLMKQWDVVRRYLMAGVGLAWVVAMPASPTVGAAPAAWPFHIAFDHNGISTGYYRLCVNNQCAPIDARLTGAGWRAPLPVLPPGEYRVVVEACGATSCVAGTPDLMIRVVASGTSRRPPIDVVGGPRIPASGR
jgi:hypothetical protein